MEQPASDPLTSEALDADDLALDSELDSILEDLMGGRVMV
jgi:hypothetical protein